MSKQLNLNEDELITTLITLSHTVTWIRSNIPPENWIFTSLEKMEALEVKIQSALYK